MQQVTGSWPSSSPQPGKNEAQCNWREPGLGKRINGAVPPVGQPACRRTRRSSRGVEVEGQVVDQAGAAEKSRGQNHQLAIAGSCRTQAVRLANFQVVRAQAGGQLLLAGRLDQLGEVALTAAKCSGDLLQAAVQGGCGGALFGVQVAVARG